MNNPFTFGASATQPVNKYAALGFSRNPFSPQDDDDQDGPFYDGHLSDQIKAVQQWLTDTRTDSPPALSIKGTIGVGKTRLLKALRRTISSRSSDEKSHAVLVSLSKTGYARPSVGQLLLDILDVFAPPWADATKSTPPGVMPLVWCVLKGDGQFENKSVLAKALAIARESEGSRQIELATFISRWLHRIPLTTNQSSALGLYSRLDFEGQVPDVLCDLLVAAHEAGVLQRLFLLIDQLEDLFRPSYSDLRQSRILTDLRGLVDRQDGGTPLGLVFAWSPDLDLLEGLYRSRVEIAMQQSYAALYSRLTRRLVTLEKLRELHLIPFAQRYMDALKDVQHNDPSKWPKAVELAHRAWEVLGRQRLIQDNAVTPRDLLAALSEVTDDMAIAASARE